MAHSPIRASLSCLASCGFVMAAMFAASHDFHIMVPLAAITVAERYHPRPRPWASAAALWAVALCLLVG